MGTDAELTPATVDLDRPLRLHPLVYLPDGDEVTIGRTDIDSYGIFPPDGAELVRRLEAGESPRRTADWYESEYGQSVDMVDVLGALYELELVIADGEVVAQAPVRWQRLGRALFSPLAWAAYAATGAWVLWLMLDHGELVPHYDNLFFTGSFSLIEIVVFLGQFPALLFHESFHALAGRRIGVRSSLGIGRRLYFVVFETTMDGLVAVPRSQRYVPMLAGMVADVLWFCGLTLAAHYTRDPDGSLSYLGGLCLALAFTTVLRFAWQFYFYLRTDLYAVVSTVLGCVDLQRASTRMLVNRFDRLTGRRPRHDEDVLHPVDRRVGRWYSWLLLVGYSVMIVTLILAGVPAMITFLSGVLGRFTDVADVPTGQLIDSMVFVALNLAQIVVIAWLAFRDRARRRLAEPLRHLID